MFRRARYTAPEIEFKALRLETVSELTTSLSAGRVIGVVGGANSGKEALLDCLFGREKPLSGEASVGLLRPDEYPDRCLVSRDMRYPFGASVRDALAACACAYGGWNAEYARALLEAFGIDPRLPCAKLGRVREKALGLTIGLASRASLLGLCEPLEGLEAGARLVFLSELEHERAEGERTILIALHEVGGFAQRLDELLVLRDGRATLCGEVERVLAAHRRVTGEPEALDFALRGLTELRRLDIDGAQTRVVRAGGAWPALATYGLQVEDAPLELICDCYASRARA